jgi:hypothetical protein
LGVGSFLETPTELEEAVWNGCAGGKMLKRCGIVLVIAGLVSGAASMAHELAADIELPAGESSSQASQGVGGFLEADGELPADESGDALREPELSATMLGVPRPGGHLEVAVEWNGALPQMISGWIDLDDDGEMARNELVLTDAVMTQPRETFRITLPPGSPTAPELRLLANDTEAEVVSGRARGPAPAARRQTSTSLVFRKPYARWRSSTTAQVPTCTWRVPA